MHPALIRLRRFALSVVLPLVLLLSQQGALLHELSHWRVPASSAVQTAGSASADSDLCLACLAYSQVGHLAGAQAAAGSAGRRAAAPLRSRDGARCRRSRHPCPAQPRPAHRFLIPRPS